MREDENVEYLWIKGTSDYSVGTYYIATNIEIKKKVGRMKKLLNKIFGQVTD